MLAVVEVPEHSDTVFATRRGERAVGRNGDGVDVASMAVVVSAEFAFREFPDLERCALMRVMKREDEGRKWSEILVENVVS